MSHIYLGRWEWFADSSNSYWRAPGGDAIGSLDLRSLSQCSKLGGIPEGFGIFVYNTAKSHPLLIRDLGEDINRNLTLIEKNALNILFGKAIISNKIVDILWELLNVLADPTGQTFCKPLMPQIDGKLVLHLGGFSAIKEDVYEHSKYPLCLQTVKEEWNKLKQECLNSKIILEQENITWDEIKTQCTSICMIKKTEGTITPKQQKIFQLATLPNPDLYRKTLTTILEKYKVTFNELKQIWNKELPEPLPHNTLETENWNCAASTNISCQLTWIENDGDWEIPATADRVRLVTDASGPRPTATATALASADHYSQLTIVTLAGTGDISLLGVVTRATTAVTTDWYQAIAVGSTSTTITLYTQKRVGGTITTLAGGTSQTKALPDLIKNQSNGSTIKSFYESVEVHSVTDTSITGNLRPGIDGARTPSGNCEGDDFEAADLAAAAETTWLISNGLSGAVLPLTE